MAAQSKEPHGTRKDARSTGAEPGVETPHPGEPAAVPELPDPPQRHDQDTQAVEGSHATNLPEGARKQQQQPVQG